LHKNLEPYELQTCTNVYFILTIVGIILVQELKTGQPIIERPFYPESEDVEILAAFEGLRVAGCNRWYEYVRFPRVGLVDLNTHLD